jgi:hypothetical protein
MTYLVKSYGVFGEELKGKERNRRKRKEMEETEEGGGRGESVRMLTE